MCGLNCGLKTVLHVVNSIFVACGLSLLATGIFLEADPGQLSKLDIPQLNDALARVYSSGYILIGVGACIFVIAICGCCGAATENVCLIGTYAGIVSLFLVAELAVIGVFYAQKDHIEKDLEVKVKAYLSESYYQPGSNNITNKAFDKAMQLLACCGWSGKSDFKNAPGFTKTNGGIPLACCSHKDSVPTSAEKSACDANRPGTVYQDGCREEIAVIVQKYSSILLGVGIGILVMELVVISVSIILLCNLRESRDITTRPV